MTDEALAIRRRAAAALELRRPAEAARLLSGLLATSPDDGRAHALMAQALVAFDPPRVDWRLHADRAVALMPTDASVHTAMAATARNAGAPTTAAKYVHRALQLAPDDTQALNVRSLIYSDLGDTRSAVRVSSTVASRMPDDPHVLVAHGMALARAGRLTDAQVQYLAALNVDPHNAFALNNLAVVRLACGDTGRAGRLLAAALSEDSKFAAAQSNLGVLGSSVRRNALSRSILGIAAAYLCALVAPWLGAVVLLATIGWAALPYVRQPAALRRYAVAPVKRADVVLVAMLVASVAGVLMALVLADPTWLLLAVSGLTMGCMIVVPQTYRRIRCAVGLRRLGIALP